MLKTGPLKQFIHRVSVTIVKCWTAIAQQLSVAECSVKDHLEELEASIDVADTKVLKV